MHFFNFMKLVNVNVTAKDEQESSALSSSQWNNARFLLTCVLKQLADFD